MISTAIKVNVLIMISLTMFARTCAKESDESSIEDTEIQTVEFKIATGEANWMQFKEAADREISTAHRTLNALQGRIDKMKGGKKGWLQNEHDRCVEILENLHAMLDQRDSEQPQEDRYDINVIAKNDSFKSYFKQELLELESELEKIQSGQ